MCFKVFQRATLLRLHLWTTPFPSSQQSYISTSVATLLRIPPQAPTRETWFCLYQPQPRRTAYLYEYDIPIDADVYKTRVSRELKLLYGKPASDCYIHSVDGESFSNCDVAAPPWYCYRVLLQGMRVGQRLGPYGPDDIVSPNRVTLPLQQRWRNNVADISDITEFLADPPASRLTANLRTLVRVAHEDGWRRGPRLIHDLLVQRWGHEAMLRHGISAQHVQLQYVLYGERL
ncbi:hypothetical protein Agub_g10480, partial [Astrephomene gubernaculifera]